MLSTRRFFLGLCLLLAAGLLGLMAFNRLIDQTRVLSGDAEHEYHYPDRQRFNVIMANQRYLRMHYLLQHGQRYDSLIVGSSRVGSMDTRRLDGHWYTLNYPAGMPYEHLHNLRLLLAQGIVPQRIVLALDRFAFYDPYLGHHVLSQLYPADWRQRIGVLAFYLLKQPSEADMDIARGRAVLRRSYKVVPADDRRRPPVERTTTQTRRHAAHEAALLAADPMPFTRNNTQFLLEDTLADLRAIEALCDEHGIELRVYMNPFHYKNYLAMDHDELDRIYTALAAWRPFRDFAGLSPYTLDNSLWDEPSHFVASVNNRMIRIVLGQEAPDGDFGAWVNAENAAAHRARQKAAIREQLPALQAYDRKLWLHPSVHAPATPP